jgi:transposase InsO family protein
MVSPLTRRCAAEYLVKEGRCSERRACKVVRIPRSVVRYVARKRKDEKALARRMHELAIWNSRYGYRRITVLLRREGWQVNKKRVHRLWQKEGLSLPLRRPRRRRCGPVGEIVNKAEHRNHVWSYDFLEDRTEGGRKLRILVVIDEYTRECLAIRVAPSMSALGVIDVLEWLFMVHGVPKYLRSDNGPEFVAKAVRQWLEGTGCQTLFIEPGSPWENGYVESFIDKLRDECLNREIFRNGKEAQEIIEAWRQEYNNYRPHSSLGYLTPTEYAKQCQKENGAVKLTQRQEQEVRALSF